MVRQFVTATPVRPSNTQQEQAASAPGSVQSWSQEPSFSINTVVRTAMAGFLFFCTVGVILVFLKGLWTQADSAKESLEVQLSWPEHDANDLEPPGQFDTKQPLQTTRKE